MASPVYRNYVYAYLGGSGNGKPVYRAVGANVGKPLWKNDWRVVVTSSGMPSGTLYLMYDDSDPDNISYRRITGFPSWPGQRSTYFNISTNVAGVTYYRDSPTSYGASKQADGASPVFRSNMRASFARGTIWPASASYETESGATGQYSFDGQMFFQLVYPWWGANNCTEGIGMYATNPASGSDKVTQVEMALPEGVWGALFSARFNVGWAVGLYTSTAQHKMGWPSEQGRESLSFSYRGIIHTSSLWAGEHQKVKDSVVAFLSAFSFTAAAEPVP